MNTDFETIEKIEVNKSLFDEIVSLYKDFIYYKKEKNKYLILPKNSVREDILQFIEFKSK